MALLFIYALKLRPQNQTLFSDRSVFLCVLRLFECNFMFWLVVCTLILHSPYTEIINNNNFIFLVNFVLCREAVKNGLSVSIGYHGNVVDLW